METLQISHLVQKHKCIVFDSCCLFTAHASGHMRQLLPTIAPRIAVPELILQKELLSFNAEPYLQDGLFAAELCDDAIYANMVKFAGYGLDNGEAFVCAIAERYGWAIASDDRPVERICSRYLAHLQLLDTPALFYHWAKQCNPSKKVLREALLAVQTTGKYRPRRSHILTPWWLSSIEIVDNE